MTTRQLTIINSKIIKVAPVMLNDMIDDNLENETPVAVTVGMIYGRT